MYCFSAFALSPVRSYLPRLKHIFRTILAISVIIMKLFSPGHRPGKHSPRFPLPENALFWMVLVLLSIGCITSLYGKAIHKEGNAVKTSANGIFREAAAGQSGRASRDYRVKGRNLPIYCVQTEKPQVALSFDAAWGNEDTRLIMDILAKHQIKVTFFMTGGWVEKYPEDVKYIAKQGHDLGNHSENHKNMSQLSEKEIRSELQQVHERVRELTGIEMTLFRPPYGDYDNKVINTADSMGYYPIQWDVDSLDWKDYGADSIIDTVLNNLHLGNGSIILMHNGAKYTPQALEAVITGLEEKGYELVPISQLIVKDGFYLDEEGRQHTN